MDLFVRETCVETVITFAIMFDDASGAEIAHFSFYIEKLIWHSDIKSTRKLWPDCHLKV